MTQTDGVAGENAVRCSTCGTDIHERAEICPECGTRQRAPPDANDDRSALAAVISVLFPGMGHMIHRQFGRGLAFMIAFYGGYFLISMVLGAPLEILLFGVWGYAIYDAYTMGWQSDDPEPDRRRTGSPTNGDSEWNQPTSEPSATATASATTPNSTPDANDGQPGSGTDPSAVEATGDPTPTASSTMTEGEATPDASMTDSQAVADSTMADGDATTDTDATNDTDATTETDGTDESETEDAFAGDEKPAADDEDSGSKWSRDDSDRSWGND